MLLTPILRRTAVALWFAWFIAALLVGPLAGAVSGWLDPLRTARGLSQPDAACGSGFERTFVANLSGSVLVAAPALTDPIFAGTRIYLLKHDHRGALGVVVNRASTIPNVWDGGPVARDSTIALVDEHAATDDALPVAPGVSILTDGSWLDDELVRAHTRVFRGHAGWGPGQLERELRAGVWRVEPGSAAEALGPSH